MSKSDFNILDTKKICNIVCTCDIGIGNLDVYRMIKENDSMYFNRNQFHTAKTRFIGSTSRLFESGNVVCTGNKSFADVLITCHSIALLLRRMGYYAVVDCIRTRNIIVGVTAPNPIDVPKLYGLLSESGQNIKYNPMKFPGCIFKSTNPTYTITTYTSGELIITGCIDYELMISMIQNFYKTYIELCMLDPSIHGDSLSSGYHMFSENTIKKLFEAIKDFEKD